MKLIILLLLVNFSVFDPCLALDLQIGDVSDRRTTGQFFRNLEIELKIFGDELNDAEAVKTQLQSAVDSTGRDLILKDQVRDKFVPVNKFSGNVDGTSRLTLANPARSADSVKEITGEMIVYIPKNDPASIVTLSGLDSFTGKLLESEILKSAQIEMLLYTVAQYKKFKEQEQQAKIAKMRADGVPEQMIKLAGEFENMMGGEQNEEQLILKVKDPLNKLIGFNLLKANGDKINNGGSMTTDQLKYLYYSEKIPADARIEIQVLTDKSTIRLPINIKGLKLP